MGETPMPRGTGVSPVGARDPSSQHRERVGVMLDISLASIKIL
jgi:hypothetical protein